MISHDYAGIIDCGGGTAGRYRHPAQSAAGSALRARDPDRGRKSSPSRIRAIRSRGSTMSIASSWPGCRCFSASSGFFDAKGSSTVHSARPDCHPGHVSSSIRVDAVYEAVVNRNGRRFHVAPRDPVGPMPSGASGVIGIAPPCAEFSVSTERSRPTFSSPPFFAAARAFHRDGRVNADCPGLGEDHAGEGTRISLQSPPRCCAMKRSMAAASASVRGQAQFRPACEHVGGITVRIRYRPDSPVRACRGHRSEARPRSSCPSRNGAPAFHRRASGGSPFRMTEKENPGSAP